MNDFESTVRARLHHLGADVPSGDALLRAEAATSLYRRRRRARLGMVSAAVAVVAIAGVAPAALGSLTADSAPQGGQVAAPASEPTQSADAEVAAAEVAARLAALDAAEQPVALDADSRVRGEADLAADAERSQRYGSVMHECLSELGIDSQVLGDGGITWTVPPGQDAAYDAAIADCKDRTGYGPATRLSDDAYRVLYTDYLAVARCLLTNGFSPVDPGSVEEFVASGAGSWEPFQGLPPGTVTSAEATCPLPTY